MIYANSKLKYRKTTTLSRALSLDYLIKLKKFIEKFEWNDLWRAIIMSLWTHLKCSSLEMCKRIESEWSL